MKHTIEEIQKLATDIRKDVIRMVSHAGSGHVAGALGMADIFAALYSEIVHHDPKNPLWEDRDRVVVSNGHICPVLYATLAHAGYFPQSELMTFREFGSRLQGHPFRTSLPGIETTSGPLGCGIAQAIGMALAAKLDNKKYDIWCIASDGEMDEGNTWEALMCAAKYGLNNLTVIVDRNNIQIDGFTESVMPLEPLKEKYEAFGWYVLEIDGHNIAAIIDACAMARSIYEKPVIIIAHTIPGKGVDFMEFDPEWHGKSPDLQETEHALKELRTLKGTIEEM
ncbi:MAG: transketolase [Candidatus Brennerbacteria bacterium CG11_big_fil_rev_8_21_14_0_20_43_10]|uniref:Transketolase n=3 Tax=Candidatus Brenneribacteriota TaxID=1817902 RepID=A0A2H9N5L9_9BACT|nr:MAG: transketolase [Parcubacteria group bacterium CG1_02_44_31]PIP50357.1 MAG: transketolase [Candidatus Brennerbacteria bacterium CG23_combo_of_CG06-09_8_20_14_all_44_41]PIR26244.1 MAG: transketolase [Candidatus Brennerbacteria bacterium CG11_big_fil_rev_8_21_14_0_20_43_10]PIX29208.1 MAG: transketolase [Candidatus Brennerbacteria bacterium CG_4_8_14_3_um_filter_43_14]PJA19304.1 MAG: transketolase [Candidatus Brennerbacteria bacterium CG_4_10_14_0_2_um_filter_43_14]